MQRNIHRPLVTPRSADRAHPVLHILIIATILASFVTVLPASRSALAIERQYQLTNTSNTQLSAQVGTAFNENVGVRVSQVSIAGNPYVNGVAITFTATTSSGGASGTFSNGSNTITITSSTLRVQNVDVPGVATAPTFTANGVAGSYQIVAVANEPTPENALPYFFFMNNTTSTANKAFQVSAGDGSLQATLLNTTYPTPFFAAVLNGNNQLLGGVTVTFTAPDTGPSGVFSSTGTNVATAVTGGTGLAVAPSFTANGIQGGYSVTASVSGDQTVSGEVISTAFGLRNSLTNVLGVPETVSASAGSGQQVSVSTTLSTNLQVAVFDGSLDHVVGASVTFTLPASGPSGLFSNGTRTYTTTTGSNGLATALPLTTNTEVGPISVAVTATKSNVSASTSLSVFNGKVLTTTTASIAPDSGSVYGQPVVVSATVRPTEGSLVPAGPVNFRSSGSLVGSCTNVTPVNGVATCTLNWLEPGNYSFSADYLGDEVSEESTSQPVAHTVTKASTTTAIQTSEPIFVLEGDSVTFTATVSPVAPGAAQPGEPTGTIAFTASDGTVVNGGNGVALVNGVATVTTSDLNVGDVTITVTYSGDGHFVGSTNSLIQHVYTIPEVTQDPASTLKLVGETVTFTAAATGFPMPTVRWQVSSDDGATFTDINGATSTTYSFTAAPEHDQYQYQAIFTNVAGSDTTAAATLTVRQPPMFTSADTTTFAVGEPGSFSVTADGILPPTLSLSGTLPDGVTFDAETGLLSGTPADGSGAAYTLTFTATNGIDPDAVQTFTLHVNEAPEFSSVDATSFEVGTAGSFTITATGYPASTFSTTDTLPAGVSLSSAGVLSGTPTEHGVFTLTVTATNGIQPDATQTFTLTVNEAPVITSADAATFEVGVAGSHTVTATGFPAPVLSLTGALPAGVTFDPASGILSGTPADGTGGTYSLTFTATNSVTTDATQTFTLTVNEAPEITSTDAATFVVGVAGSFSVTASGFPDSTFSAAGTLPAGVSLSSNGELSGTPVDGSGAVYTFVITATNGVSPDATQTFTLTVNDAPEITSATATTFVVGQPGSFSVTASAFPLAAFSVAETLPSGLSFSNTGVLSGTPADGTGGVYTLTITATNSITPDATQTFTLTINEAPAITSPDTVTFILGESNTFTATASGYPGATFSSSGTLPAGVTLSTAGVLSGTPAVGTAGTYALIITATNGVAPDATQNFTLSVVPPEVIAPADITVSNDLNQAGAVVTYPAPTTVGNVGAVTCTPASGSFFPIGSTTVTCSSTSGLSDSFTITVNDTQPPAITVPANISVQNMPGQSGAIVIYPASGATDNAPGVTVACIPASGSFFPIGTTTVTCTATDAARNTTVARFTVTVLPTTQHLLDQLRGNTATLVTNAATERALLATLDKVQRYLDAGQPFQAYMTMLQFAVQVDQFENSRRITPAVAGQLMTQAQQLARSIL